MTSKGIREKGKFPCIIHWNMNHFVVLDGFRGKYAYLNDPAQGEVRVTEEEFDQAFTGIAIIPTPSDTFEPGGKQRSTVDFARKSVAEITKVTKELTK